MYAHAKMAKWHSHAKAWDIHVDDISRVAKQ